MTQRTGQRAAQSVRLNVEPHEAQGPDDQTIRQRLGEL